jgi:hypothetical protein
VGFTGGWERGTSLNGQKIKDFQSCLPILPAYLPLKFPNGQFLSYTVSVEKMWTQNTRIIHDVWRLLILSNEDKTNDYENFEKGKIYMKIW